MSPPPEKVVARLLAQGKVTPDQARMARTIPMSHDICVEADSGGHTDQGVACALFPSIQSLREKIHVRHGYEKKVRVGLAGGIGTPHAAAAAFVMGADFILTGSINQCTVEAGTSDAVKDMLQDIDVQDTEMAPAGDMFEIGAKVQVLKKGVLFPARANKLYGLYTQYPSWESIPESTRKQIEEKYFGRSFVDIWQESSSYLQARGRTSELARAAGDPRHRMAIVFKWYFRFSSAVARKGMSEQRLNFQIHTGPALGAFNQWVADTPLRSWRERHVEDIADRLMQATAQLLSERMASWSALERRAA